MNVHYFKELWKSSLMILMLCFGLTSLWGQETESLTIVRGSFPNGSNYTVSTWSATATTGETITGKSNLYLNTIAYIQIGGSNTPHPYNIDAIPGAITKIQITMPGSGSLRQWTPRVSATSSITTASGGTPLTAQTFTSNTQTLTWNLDAADNYKYFYLQAGGNTNIASIVIEYQVAASEPCDEGTLTAGTTVATPQEVTSGGSTNLSLDGASTGTGLSYQWQSSANGTDWSDIGGATNATYSATNITAATYFRAAVTCGETTVASAPVQVTLAYCSPNSDCTDGDRITNFVLESISNNSGSTCTPNGYNDYTAQSTDLTQGELYNGTLTNGSWGSNFAIWIDFNDDAIFSASERVFATITNVAGESTSPISISIPEDAPLGQHRMRVRLIYGNPGTTSSTLDPCTVYTENSLYGEIEDYTVNIVAAGPVLTVDPATVTGLQAIEGGAALNSASFTLSGQNLDGNDVILLADEGFVLSTDEEGTYEEEITLTAFDGTDTTIWVQIAAGQNEGPIAGDIFISGGGADDLLVSVSGEVLSSDPILTLSEEMIENLGYTFGAATSVPASFTISGLNMDGSGDVMLAFENLDTDFEMSLAADGTYTDYLLIEDYDGTETTIYVRLKLGREIGNSYADVLEILTDYDVNESVLVFAEVTAPVINTTPDTIVPAMTAIAGETDTETVTVSGTLTANVTATLTGADADQFSVDPGSVTSAGGDFTVTYQPYAVGEHTATLVLSTNGDVTKELTLNGTATFGVPVATDATAIGSDSFTANWNAVAGADSYEIDVYTVEGTISEVLDEDFSWSTGVGGNDGSWSNINPSNANLATDLPGWSGSTVRKSDSCVQIGTSSSQGSLTTPELGFTGNGTLTFRAGAWNGGNEQTTLRIEITGGGNLNLEQVTMVKGAFSNYEVQITEATASTKITFKGWAASNSRFFLDDVKIIGGSEVATPITDSPFTVSAPATSLNVTGLDPETTYYYVVRAVAGEETSVNSNQVEVETLEAPAAIVWTTDNEWSNETGPTITDNVIIEGDLTLTGNLSAKTLTVADGGKITVPANTSLTVEGKITNNGEFTVESDGILYQNNYTGTNEGNITVKRAANPMKRLDYTLWSSPVSGMLLNQFSNVSPNGGTGTIWNRVYELGADAWSSIWESYAEASTSTDTFVEAKGYLYRAFNSYDPTETTIFTGEFTGVPNNGEYSINTPNTFDAIGNPYPSPISADDFILSNDVDAIYFWTNVNSSNGTEYVHNNWASYTLAGGVGVAIGGDSENIDPDTIPADDMHIQPGQGFVVYTEENSVSFDNSMRINSNGQFFRAMNDERNRFWLNLSNEEVTFNQILVGYMDNATQGVDTGIDGKMFAYEGNALYSIIDNNEDMFVIQGRALPFTASDVVALGFRAVNAGSFTISLNNVDGLFANNQNIYLKDNFTQSLHNLKEGAYTFVSEEGIFNTRFEVVYQTTMSVENPIANNANWIVYSQENGYQIQTQGLELKSVQVFDLLGRAIYTASAEGTAHHIPSLGADSVYIVKVTTTDNVVLSKKVK